MPKRISAADATPVRVVIVTLDNHAAGATKRARASLAKELPGLTVDFHAAAAWGDDPAAVERCRADIAKGDIILTTMMFMEDHVRAVMPDLLARRDHCDAMLGCLSAAEVVRLTRTGKLSMSGETLGALAWLKRLRGSRDGNASSGHGQMKMLRQLPRLLRFVPGKAQDLRAYLLVLQYWLAGTDENVANLIRFLIARYADGERRALRERVHAAPPVEYPEIGVYHPRLKERISDRVDKLPAAGPKGTVGLLVMRSYVLAGNTAHYDGVIAALEARGLRVIPVFAAGLDARPAIEKYFLKQQAEPNRHFIRRDVAVVDAMISLTGFSLVGGPAYNDAKAAEEMLARLDVPYLAAHPVEFQTLEQWEDSDRGLHPIEATIMVAIPELDGSTGPMVFGGVSSSASPERGRDMQSHPERASALAARVARLIALRRTPAAQRKLAIVLFNFPPNAGATGTAAFLSVFESLHNTMTALKAAGYTIDVPQTPDALRAAIVNGNAGRFGAEANVLARIPADDHVRRERHLAEIEAQWGPAPGRKQSDGASIFVLGQKFGNVLVGVQPAFGYEGDPMRLLFEKSFAPTHAFSAFYRYLREDFGAHAVLHFGTHGALEFMPGKQVGLSCACWPDRLIADLPNFYLYAANNPSEGSIAKRRAAATLISYLTPPVTHAGLYRGLADLKASVERWRSAEELTERGQLATLIQAQAAQLDLAETAPEWNCDADGRIAALSAAMLELEYTLIPHGLHIVGRVATTEERADLVAAIGEAGGEPDDLARAEALLAEEHELPGLVHALDGRFVRPASSGDLIRAPAILPTGRNLHGFDPFRIPSAYAVQDGARQAAQLITRHLAEGHPFPQSIAIVLWGTDNLKSEGTPIAQALALIGARPRRDGYGRLAGAELVPLEELGRPRIDLVAALSGIFRDLLPLQTRMLAEASFLAASAEEPPERNFVRKHALQYQAAHGCDLATASLRVFSNADGAYGANVNHLIDASCWSNESELAETFTRRRSFAYGRDGKPVQQVKLFEGILRNIDLAYQNLESVELGVTTVDHYFDNLGGIARAVEHARGANVPVYIGDQTRGRGLMRTLGEQVALESRTRTLNPKWYEGMLKHGYEGVRHIEAHVTNTMGWSATTGQVAPWIYQQVTETYIADPAMRERLAALNPVASAKIANRLLEAHDRKYWSPDAETLETLRRASEDLEDLLEGVGVGVAA
jgi:magnesium chelatase subunit H